MWAKNENDYFIKSNTSLKVKIWKIVGVGAGEDEWFSLKSSTVRKPLFS